MKRDIIISLLLPFLFFAHCKKEEKKKTNSLPTYKAPDPSIDEKEQIYKDKKQLRAEVKQDYKITNASSDRTKAVTDFLSEAANKGESKEYDHLFNDKELRDIYLPNITDTKVLIANTTIAKAMYILKLRKQIGVNKMLQTIYGKKFKLKEILWRRDIREVNAIKFHIIDGVLLEIDGKTFELEAMKAVLEHEGQFKLCIVGT
ncbi:MAG: hypothetical protein AAF518_22525 [Spirochaetota bacterium]